MSTVHHYRQAKADEQLARLRRILALRSLVAEGLTQREIAEELGISQSAVSQQLKSAPDLASADPVALLDAARPVLKSVAESRGYKRLAVFGSVATGHASPRSDIDLIVDAPEHTSSFDFVRFKELLERIVGRQVDLITYNSLTPGIDDDIRRAAVLL